MTHFIPDRQTPPLCTLALTIKPRSSQKPTALRQTSNFIYLCAYSDLRLLERKFRSHTNTGSVLQFQWFRFALVYFTCVGDIKFFVELECTKMAFTREHRECNNVPLN